MALLDLLDIKGSIVTIDAMGCQKAIAKERCDKEADYVIAVKGNQGHLHQSIKVFFTICQSDNFKNVAHEYYEEVDSGHGRIEVRRYWITDVLTSISDLTSQWNGVISVRMAESKRHVNGKVSKKIRYFICSIDADAKVFGNAVRKPGALKTSYTGYLM